MGQNLVTLVLLILIGAIIFLAGTAMHPEVGRYVPLPPNQMIDTKTGQAYVLTKTQPTGSKAKILEWKPLTTPLDPKP